MTEPSFLQEAVETLEQATDTVATVGDLVVQGGGRWNDALAQETQALFEIHLFGIAGVGLGAEAAAQNWLEAARTQLSEQAPSKASSAEPELSS